MKLFKTAARKAGKRYNITDEDLIRVDQRGYSPPNRSWNDQIDKINIQVRGEPRSGSMYDYTISLSVEEVLKFVEMAIDKSCTNKYERALGSGAISVIRELLSLKDDESAE